MKEKNQIEEKLPNIYSSTNTNTNPQSNQSISRRNEIIEEYLLSMEKKGNGFNEISLTSEEDDKDPFSSKAIKNLKPLKKDTNKLILPNFAKREKLKNELSTRNCKIKESSNSYSINNCNNNLNFKNDKNPHIKMTKKNKNYSEQNIYGTSNNNTNITNNTNVHLGKFLNNNNNNLNSKWTTSSNSYNNYINGVNNNICNINQKICKYKINNINKNSKENKGRSRSHIGNKPSYYLYNEKNINFLNNKGNTSIHNKKYISTQVDISQKNNNHNFVPKNYKRNYTAKILKNKKISLLENNKQFKKGEKARVYSTLSTRRIIENKHQIYKKLINEKDNPYGLGWINKMLGKNNEEKLGLTRGFVNGVPVVKILSKVELSKREIKKRLSEIERKKKEEENKNNKIINAQAKTNEVELEDEYNIPKEILEQFNKNTKNFYKFRKDIIEEPEEEEEQQTSQKCNN